MSDNYRSFDKKEISLSHLLIDTAGTAAAGEAGAPVTDEELSLFAQTPDAEDFSAVRREQILAQLATNPELYERWVMLNRYFNEPLASAAEAPAASRATARPAAEPTFLQWLTSLLTPQTGFAAAFGAVCALGLTFLLGSPSPTEDTLMSDGPGLAVRDAMQQPERATQQSITEQNALSAPDLSISQIMRCQQISALNSAEVCFSNTLGQQHWFLTRPPGVTIAIEPLTAADRILDIQSREDMLLIESQSDSTYRLQLLQLRLEDQTLLSRLRHETKLEGGYFDGVSLTAEALQFIRVRADGSKESQLIRYDEMEP